MAGFYCQIPVGHVEAGLRTETIKSPFPEEGYRRLIGRIAEHHFTPTSLASKNLVAEGIKRKLIFKTGNTVIDSVLAASGYAQRPHSLPQLDENARIVLATAHRRENWDDQMDGICDALIALRDQFADVEIVMPVHANPRVKGVLERRLANEPRIHLIGALPYLEFVWLMNAATLILSDSGGVQEEAAALNTPVLVMRDRTERTEAIKAGTAKLVGNDAKTIVRAARVVLKSLRQLNKMRNRKNPFGDGFAAARIADIIAASENAAKAGEVGGKSGGVYYNPARRQLGRHAIQSGLVANRA
jgi:UDP-N-acetylglucosamine 2-epimerase (non-hydrolysing)